jgi:hypothetical protein
MYEKFRVPGSEFRKNEHGGTENIEMDREGDRKMLENTRKRQDSGFREKYFGINLNSSVALCILRVYVIFVFYKLQ